MHHHTITPSQYPDYDSCTLCGSLLRRGGIDAEAVYGGDYWNREGHSTLREQIYNIQDYPNEVGETKAEAVLKHLGHGAAALEIACAPGVLLRSLRRRYVYVDGIEYDSRYREEIEAISGCAARDLYFGSFPSITSTLAPKSYDAIIGLDILEHLEDGKAAVREVRRLLRPGGVAVFMLPALFDDGRWNPAFLHPEHLAIYSQSYLREWFGEMFSHVAFDRWIVGHEVVIGRV